MSDLTILDNRTYAVSDLTTKYKEFVAPAFQILIDGQDLKESHLIIHNLTIENSLDKADSFSFRVVNAFSPLIKQFQLANIAIGKEIEIKPGYVDVLETVFKGYITSLRYELTPEEETTVVVSGMDKSFKLMKGVKSRVFKDVKDSDVASQLISEGGLTAKVDSTSIVYTTLQQVAVSNYQFLRWLAERNGYEFFVSGDQAHFRKPPSAGSSSVTLVWGQTLLSLYLEDDISDQTGTVKVRSWDPQTKAALLGVSGSISKIGSGDDGTALLNKLLGKVEDNYFSEARTQNQLEIEAKAIKDRSAMKLVSGEATCIGMPEIRAGKFIQLSGLGSELSQQYYVLSARHCIDESGYTTTISIGGNAI
ncbi:MAG: phage late control D family protein [Methylocystaceae bacterium]